jgi:hypothetical protein
VAGQPTTHFVPPGWALWRKRARPVFTVLAFGNWYPAVPLGFSAYWQPTAIGTAQQHRAGRQLSKGWRWKIDIVEETGINSGLPLAAIRTLWEGT